MGIDGVIREIGQEDRINEWFALTFNTPLGEEIVDYLRGITIDSINGPRVSDQELRHMEGQRYIVQVMLSRIQKGTL